MSTRGSGIPVQAIAIDGQRVTLVALPLIFAQFREEGKKPDASVARAAGEHQEL
jgi:hypothetical protein